MVSVSVSDNGNGIADEQKSRVFDMFYTGTNIAGQSAASIRSSLCKSIINAHGGKIRYGQQSAPRYLPYIAHREVEFMSNLLF